MGSGLAGPIPASSRVNGPPSRRRRALLAVAAAVSLASCGTTVPLNSRQANGPGGGLPGAVHESASQGLPGGAPASGSPSQGGASGQTAGASGSSTAPGGGPLAAPGSQTVSGGGPTAGRADVQGASATAGSLIPPSGRGWDRQYIYVGVTTNQDLQGTAQTVGIKSLDSGNQKGDAEAMIAALNAEGGLFGRKLKGVYLDIQTANDPNSSAQAACAFMSQDNKVVAVINGALENDTEDFRTCMAKAGIPVLALGGQPLDDQEFERAHGLYTQIIEPSWNRLAPVLASSLVQQGYFNGWDTALGAPGSAPVKVGLLSEDSPQGHRVDGLVASALARVGHPVTESYFYSSGGSALSPDGAAALQAAVYRFRADGITHVISTDQFIFLFMENAESQHYRPRYGISSGNAPTVVVASTVPLQQLVGSVGFGYSPNLDVDSAHDPNLPAANACRSIMVKAGLNYSGRRFADGYSLGYCDAFELLASAFRDGGGLGAAQISAGLARAGSSFAPGSTFESALSANNHAVPGGGHDLRWDTGCTCYEYAGPLRPF